MTDFSELVDALRVMEAKETAAKLVVTPAEEARSRQLYLEFLQGRTEGTVLLAADPIIAAAEAVRCKKLFRARHAALKSGKN